MGLDMYLKASRYVGGWSHQPDEETDRFKAIVSALGATDWVTDASPSIDVAVTVGYWRKSNQVHAWFVKEVQGGEDECREHPVSREKLHELCGLCLLVLSDRKQAARSLPTQSGFFFGGTDVDDYYFEDLERTVAIINKALTMPEDWSFSYRSSW